MKDPYATGRSLPFVRLLLTLLLLIPWLLLTVQAQTTAPAWQLALSGNNNQPTSGTSTVSDVAADASGNAFVTGSFTGSVTFGTTRLTSGTGNRPFVAKWDATAQAWAWAITYGNATTTSTGIAVNGTGVYLTGNYQDGTDPTIAGQTLTGTGTMFVAKYTDTGSSLANGWALNGAGTAQGIAAGGTSVYVTGSTGGMFLAKYTDNGTSATTGWVTTGSGSAGGAGRRVAVSGTSVYVTGEFSTTIRAGAFANFAGQTLPVGANSIGTIDMFLAKYTDNGSSFTNGWATNAGGSGTDQGNGLAVNGTSVYVTGNFFSNSNFVISGQALSGVSGGNITDMFLAKFTDNGGSFSNGWATFGGGTSVDAGTAVAASGTSVYVTGYYNLTASFAGQTLPGNGNLFVASYTDNGTSFANGWATRGFGIIGSTGLAISGSHLYVGATVGADVAYLSSDGQLAAPANSALLAELTPAGTWQRAEGPLQGGSSAARATAVDASGNVFVTGTFLGSVGFGATRLVSRTGSSFVAKWNAGTGAWAWVTSNFSTTSGIAVSGTNVYVTGRAGNDIFLTKYADNGNSVATGWTATGGGTSLNAGTAVAVSGANVYVTGYYTNGPNTRIAGQGLAGVGSSDMFLAKYIDNGASFTNGWAVSGGGTSDDLGGLGVAVSGSSVYVTGVVRGGTNVSFGTQPLAGIVGADQTFVVKYTDNGTSATDAWVTGSTGTGSVYARAIAASSANVYVTGEFYGNVGIAGQALTSSSSSNNTMFVAKFSDSGTTFVNGGATSATAARSQGLAIAANGADVYVTGNFTGPGAIIAGQALPTPSNLPIVFVAKYTDTGYGFANGWATSAAGKGSTDGGTDVAVYGKNVYVVGLVTPAAQFGSLTLANPVGSSINFLAKLVDFDSPTLTSFSPSSGAAGTPVVLTGTGFTGATLVSFNGTAAPGFVVNSPTQITVSVPAGATTGLIAVVTPGGLATSATAFTVTLVAGITAWTGAANFDWFDARNWTAGVPTATTDAIISSGSPLNSPIITVGAVATVRNLTMGGLSSLQLKRATLNVKGDFLSNGMLYDDSASLLLLDGSSPQTLSGPVGTVVNNLSIGVAGATLAAPCTVLRVLTLTGNLTSTTTTPLTLQSGPVDDALVVNSGGVVVGPAIVQRAIYPNGGTGTTGYHHYSAPVSNSTVSDLATSTFTPMANPAYNTSATPNLTLPFPTVFGYDDSRLSLVNQLNSFDKGFFSPITLSDPLVVGRGYTVNISASQLVDFRGTLTTGDQTLSLTSTRPNYPADGGWQLLGNPYPAPLDYSLVNATDRAGLEAAIYVYQSTSQYAGRYRSYINGIGNPVLPVGQGFFARVAAGQTNASITFRNSQRLTTPTNTAFLRTAAETRSLVQLTLQDGSGALADEATVYFEAGATTGFEPAFDAEKLPNSTGLNLSTSQGGRQFSIDGQPELTTGQRVVPLAVGVPAAGVYTFRASQLLNLSAVPVYLRDLQLGTLTDLRQQPSYQFTISNAVALNTTRFELVFSPQQALATVPVALAQQVALYPNPAHTQATIELPASLSRQPVTAALLDALGRVIHQQQLPAGLATHALSLADVAPGVYTLRLTTEQGTISKQLAVE
jgi:hypothetical protein